MKTKRVILDTNLWISFLITQKFKEIDGLIQSQKIVLVFSDELLEEFIEVARRPKFKKIFAIKDIETLLETIDQFADLINVSSEIDICRDEKDNFLLNLAVDGKADFLVTGDNDLLILEKIKDTKILTFPDFIAQLKSE